MPECKTRTQPVKQITEAFSSYSPHTKKFLLYIEDVHNLYFSKTRIANFFFTSLLYYK